MRRVVPLTLGVMTLALLMAAPASRRASGSRQIPEARHTIEPTLPVTVDLRLGRVLRRAPGGAALLEAAIDVDSSASATEVVLRLPVGVSAEGGDLQPGRPFALNGAGRRLLAVPLRAGRDGDLPIEVEVSFRLPDGTPIISRQGVMLRFGPPGPEGRSHLGAHEMMAVPLQDLGR